MNLFYLVLLSRGVYAAMWFYTAPMLPSMLSEFNVPPAAAGLMPAAFIAGAAAFQIPAGILGARLGHNKTAGVGMLIFGFSSISLGLSPSWTAALLSRALGGVGAGLFFSTAGAVLVHLRPRDVGSALGWYNASFNMGAFVGYYWGFISTATGWRAAAVIPGLLSVLLGVLLMRGAVVTTAASIDRRAFVFGLVSFAFWGSVFAANSLTATWLHVYRKVGEDLAGAISSAAMISGFLGGLFGKIYDRSRNKAAVLVAPPAAASLVFLAIPTLPAFYVTLAAFMYGALFSLYITSIYAMSSRASGNPASALAAVNVTNMALGVHVSYLFSWLMEHSEALPWALLATLTFFTSISTYIVVNRIKIY